MIFMTSILSLKSQNISPNFDTEQCPGVAITFSASVPGNLDYVAASAISVAPTLIQGAYHITRSSTLTTFNFDGKFVDYNNNQTFTAYYYDANQNYLHRDFTFTKVKSLLNQTSKSTIIPNQSSITALRCQSQNFNISFPQVPFSNVDQPTSGFNIITNYEYLIPIGWSLNGSTSNGSNWIPGTNNSTITSDLTHGDQQTILIRSVNSCGAGLTPGQPSGIAINRPAPTLSITGSDLFCSSTSTYSVNGVPSGSTISWSLSNGNASIPNPSNGNSVIVTMNSPGNDLLTATITDCNQSYTVNKQITFGPPSANTATARTYTANGNSYGLSLDCADITDPNGTGGFVTQITRTDAVATNFNWIIKYTSPNFLANMAYYPDGAHPILTLKPQGGNVQYELDLSNACGMYKEWYNFNANYNCIPVFSKTNPINFIISPNPAQDYVKIELITEKNNEIENKSGKIKNKNLFYTLRINNTYGNLVKSFESKIGTTSASIYVGNLNPGIYSVAVFDGSIWNSKQLIIKK